MSGSGTGMVYQLPPYPAGIPPPLPSKLSGVAQVHANYSKQGDDMSTFTTGTRPHQAGSSWETAMNRPIS